jgi:hypothetical protein
MVFGRKKGSAGRLAPSMSEAPANERRDEEEDEDRAMQVRLRRAL